MKMSHRKKLMLHYLKILMFLTIALLGGIIIFGYAVTHFRPFEQIDAMLYEAIHNSHHQKWIDHLINPFNFNFLPRSWGFTFPSFFYIWIALFLSYMGIKDRKNFGWSLFCLIVGSYIIMQLFTFTDHYINRERPFLVLPNQLDKFSIEVWRHWPTFPSGHARETALYGVIMTYFVPWLKWPVIVFALFIGYSRIYLGAHYPTDVLAGYFIGALAGLITLKIMEEIKLIVKEIRDEKPEKTKKNTK